MGRILIVFMLAGACDQLEDAAMTDIHGKVVEQTLAQYKIAKESGQKMDACVHAGIVAASYLQAQDQQNYEIWKAVEKTDCALAGLPK